MRALLWQLLRILLVLGGLSRFLLHILADHLSHVLGDLWAQCARLGLWVLLLELPSGQLSLDLHQQISVLLLHLLHLGGILTVASHTCGQSLARPLNVREHLVEIVVFRFQLLLAEELAWSDQRQDRYRVVQRLILDWVWMSV